MNPENKLDRALSVFTSWLHAVKIPFSLNYPKISIDNCIDVVFVDTPDPNITHEIQLSSSIMASPDGDTALKEFHRCTSMLGYGTPCPINRGALAHNPRTRREGLELNIFRHRELHWAPNNPPDLHKYTWTGTSVSRWFLNKNRYLLKLACLELEDLESFARIWTLNFLHRHRKVNKNDKENNKLLNVHLQNRFIDLLAILSKKVTGYAPDYQTIATTFGTTQFDYPIGPTTTHQYYSLYSGVGGAKTPNEFATINIKNKTKRRKNAQTLLHTKLANMGHEKMVSTLQEVIENSFVDPVARDCAKRTLIKHQLSCQQCVKKN